MGFAIFDLIHEGDHENQVFRDRDDCPTNRLENTEYLFHCSLLLRFLGATTYLVSLVSIQLDSWYVGPVNT